MKILKANRTFEVEIRERKIYVREGNEEVDAYLSGDTLQFRNPNENIVANGKPLTGLRITREESHEINQAWRSQIDAALDKNATPDEEITEIHFHFGDNFEVRIDERLSQNLREKVGKLKAFWLMDNAKEGKRVPGKSSTYMITKEQVETELERREQLKQERIEKTEGAIAFNVCWECGVPRVAGQIKNGRQEQMPSDLYKKVKADFSAAWKRHWSSGKKWQEEFGYKVVVVGKKYCGC